MGKNTEEREESKQIRNLRAQLIKSRKSEAQLRKRVHQLEGMLIDMEDVALQQEEEKFNKKVKPEDKKSSLTCPRCGSSNIGEFELVKIKRFNCLDCGCKGKV